MDGITKWLELNGYNRTSTGASPRLCGARRHRRPLSAASAIRCVSTFSATRWNRPLVRSRTQRSTDTLRALSLVPVTEFQLTMNHPPLSQAMSRRSATRQTIRSMSDHRSRRHPGMEHWLALFHGKLDTLSTMWRARGVLEPLAEDAARERFAQIADYYQARAEALEADRAGTITSRCRPAIVSFRTSAAALEGARCAALALQRSGPAALDAGTRQGRNFAPEAPSRSQRLDP